MARISDIIEEFINQLIREAEGTVEIGRNELADYFNCAPSQINYVLTTRFTTERGYYIESRRGGGGCIKISKIDIDNQGYLKNILSKEIGDNLNKERAFGFVDFMQREGFLSERESNIIKAAVDDSNMPMIPKSVRNIIRAAILKAMLVSALV
ncbi:CtsR family transcriptional regulator [Lutispora saccharofermentans]|uniref:CtsR family transcriptional regulator n=1 Tax=Lutispora saccharofermentans TaxID=3024236 RepID=A0ABT1NI72_9FIRM|nr:CtsR family transcriptional regulator [Lutispora saccharofermentans]MCQ1530978.1 CtsR family transcriptional regulator [Lutispora saccharofermentans]